MLRKRSVTLELRLRAQLEAKREAQEKLKRILLTFLVGFTAVVGLFFVVATDVLARESRKIEDVHALQLARLIKSKDFVAVFWYARNCRLCEEALEELESIDDDAEKFSVDFVKVNDKRLAKSQYGVKRFPALTFFRDGQITTFEGDLTDEDEVLEFLTSENLLVIPDKIEEVNAANLLNIIAQESFVTALFYDFSDLSAKVLGELEQIDDEADIFKIRFVKIKDVHLAEEFSLSEMPTLVYFRTGIPIVYHGDLTDEEEVLEWLIQNQSSADDEDVVESVGKKELEIMIRNVDHLLVLFHDNKKKSQQALQSLEQIDDDCDRIGVSVVEVDDAVVARDHGVEELPTLVYFEGEIPAVYPGEDLDDAAEEILSWLTAQVEGSDIEEVRAEMLDRMVLKEEHLAVLFYDSTDKKSYEGILEGLEEIDDDLDEEGLALLKTGDTEAAQDYGIEERPALCFFRRGIPNLYQGKLEKPGKVLNWLLDEIKGEKGANVEVVTDAMLERLILTRRYVAVFFYDKRQKASQKAMEVIEEIDAELHKDNAVFLVKLDDREEAAEYGIKKVPGLVLFENSVGNLFEGDLFDSEEILGWLNRLVKEDNIEQVTVQMLEKMSEEQPTGVAAFLYHKNIAQDRRILNELEKIDDDLERLVGVHLVKMAVDEEDAFVDQHGIQVVPSLIVLKEGGNAAVIYNGDIGIEKKVVQWIEKVFRDDDQDDDSRERIN